MDSGESGMNAVVPLHDQSTERIFANAEREVLEAFATDAATLGSLIPLQV